MIVAGPTPASLLGGLVIRFISLVLICAATVAAADPQPAAPGRRPKIGLALSGGAALGLSHVGVLQWLEENRIPVDFIAGTSMGALVGGIHASGMTSSEMLDFVRQIDWQATLASSTPYRNLSFRRKEDVAQFTVALELGLKNGRLNLPSGLSPGGGVSLVLDRFAAPYGDLESFDRLPTPFRCVASDLLTGKGVVFDRGSLFDALRASMSLPALFAPVRKDGRILVDGGLTNNLPVDVVRAMGADIVIAVALETPVEEKDFESLLGIAGRSISYLIAANERPNLAAADVVLMPSLKGMGGTDYGKWEEFRRVGFEAAVRKQSALRQFQVPEAEYAAYTAGRQARRRPVTIRPATIVVEGDVAPRLKSAVIAALTPAPGATVDRAVLEEQMSKLTGTGRFDVATYEFRSSAAGESLVVKVQEKRHGPPLLRPLLYLDGANGEGLRFGAGARLTFLDLGGPASEWRTDLAAGTVNRVDTEYYYRIRGGKWFLAPRAGLLQDPLPFYNSKGDRIAEITEKNYWGGADAGYAFGRSQELRFGYQAGYLKTSRSTGSFDPAAFSGRYGFTHLTLRRDTRDDAVLPSRGRFLQARAFWYDRYPLAPEAFAAFEGSVTQAFAPRDRYVILTRLQAGGTTGDPGPAALFRLGGFGSLSALSRQQLLGSRMYYGQAYLLRGLTAPAAASAGRFYGLIGYEAGNAWFPGGAIRPRQDGLIGIAGATPVGAFFFGGSIGGRGERKVLFRLGRTF